MTVVQATPIRRATDEVDDQVTVDGDTVVIRMLEVHDPEVAAFIGEAADPAEAAHQCLVIGARAAQAVQVTIDSHVVEKKFEQLSAELEDYLTRSVDTIKKVTEEIFDGEDGALTRALTAHKAELEQLLGSTFDPDSKKSVLALFERVMQLANDAQNDQVRRLVSLDGDDSPLGKLQQGMARELKTQLDDVKQNLAQVSEKLAVNAAVEKELERSTYKGHMFEEVLDSVLNTLAAPYGDTAERTGTEVGNAGNKKGDEVVLICRDDTPGGEGCIVFEAKRKRMTMPQILAELDAAIENRGAQAGVAVFSDQTVAPTSVPFQYSENRAIVVLDKDGKDTAALRLAYMWARWMARRAVAAESSGDGIDLERFNVILGEASRALERAATIRREHTKARRAIEQAGEQLDHLTDEVAAALDRLGVEIR